MEYYSAIKKNNIMPFATTWMGLEIVILSKSDKDKYLLYSFYVESIKMIQMNVSTIKNRLTDLEQKLIVTKGGKSGVWD